MAQAWCARNRFALHGWSGGVPDPDLSEVDDGLIAQKDIWYLNEGDPDPAGRAERFDQWAALLQDGVYIYNTAPETVLKTVWVKLDISQLSTLQLWEVAIYQLGDPDNSDPGGGTNYNGGFARLKVTALTSGYAANSISVSETLTNGSWNASTLTGGQDSLGKITDGETVTIGTTVYTFKDTLGAAFDVQIESDSASTITNLILAINLTGTAGVNYGVGTTAHPSVTATAGVVSGSIVLASTLTGELGNADATTETMAFGSFANATMVNGVTPTWLAYPGFTFSSIASAVDSGAQGYTITCSVDDSEILFPELRSGAWERAQCALRLVDYNNPNNGYLTFFGGEVGPLKYTEERNVEIDVQGYFTRKRQWPAEVWSPTCRADLGDTRCRYNIDQDRVEFTVTQVDSTLEFRAAEFSQADEHWTLGVLQMLTGNNAGLAVEIESSTQSTTLVRLMQPFPFDIQVGDTGQIWPGCDKNYSTCGTRYNNTINFQGEPFYPTSKGIVVG